MSPNRLLIFVTCLMLIAFAPLRTRAETAETKSLMACVRAAVPAGWLVSIEGDTIVICRRAAAVFDVNMPSQIPTTKMGPVQLVLKIYSDAGAKDLTAWHKQNDDQAYAIQMLEASLTPASPDQLRRMDAYYAAIKGLKDHPIPHMWAKEGALIWVTKDDSLPEPVLADAVALQERGAVRAAVEKAFSRTPINP